MQIRHAGKLGYAAVWAAIAVAVAGLGSRVLADLEDDLEPESAAQAYADATELPEELSSDGTTIRVGDPEARTVVRLYEDPRCPVVADFEASGAKAVRAQTIKREARTEYTLASFKDDRLGGDGSKRAVNALRAALDVQKFTEYHAVLTAHQEEVESSGGYTTQRLLSLADQVPGLRSETFDAAVSTMKYSDFVAASQKAYQRTGDDPIGPGTPSVVINDKQVTGGTYQDLFDEDELTRLLAVIRKTPEAWRRRAS
ncbi:thioredoxin domain-containing protein [Streptomyces sp. NPDC046876]|uniref:thioredoxin domain-containing protein n=1 Tax=Streptomyces sp. NPDC046876 TaxID=3155616 RepID=UPI0033F1A437